MKAKSLKINAILNTVKQCCTILFPLITFPYISRVLGATEYGKVNFSMTFVNYFFLMAALGISTYAIREGAALRNDKRKFQIFVNQIFTINLISTLIAYIIIFFVLIFFSALNPYKNLIGIGAIGIIFTTLGRDWVNSIFEDFGYLTIRYLITQSLAVVLIFLLVRNNDGSMIYTLIITLAPIIANICNLFYIKKYVRLQISFQIEWKKHLKPIIILFANAVAISIYMNIDITMLGIFKTDTDVGIYSSAVKLYSMVKQIINALIVVAIPRFSYLALNNEIEKYEILGSKILNSIISILIPAVIGLFILSKEAMLIISGEEYESGFRSLQILSISLLFAIIASFFTQGVLIPFRKEKVLFRATLISALTNVLLNLIFIPLYNYNGAAFTTMIAEAGMCILCYLSVRNEVHLKIDRKTLKSSIFGCIVIALTCLICKRIVQNLWIYTVLSIGISILLYGVVLIYNKNDIIYPIVKKILHKLKKNI